MRNLKKENQTRRRNCLPKIITAVLVVGFVVSIFSTISAFATANLFKIENAEISELSTTAEGAITSFNETNIVSDVTFHQLNDSAKYTITLKNTDTKDHVIESITDDNENPYISYEYDQHTNEQINAGEDLIFIVTAKYTTAITDINQRAQATNVKFFIHFTDIEEVIPIMPNTGANPNTGDFVHFSVISLAVFTASLAFVYIVFLKKHKKILKIFSVAIALISAATITVFVNATATTDNELDFSFNINLKDRLVVSWINTDGNKEEKTINYGGTIDIPEPSKNGYTFADWTDEEGNTISLDEAITDDITLSPIFNANEYTIRLNANNTSGDIHDIEMKFDETKQLPANPFAYTGHTFTGWNTAINGSGDDYDDAAEVSNLSSENGTTINLYAQWATNAYIITFDSNAPESTTVDGSMDDVQMTYNEAKTLPSNTFKIQGFVFSGWNTKADGTGTTIADEAEVINLAQKDTITLYAVWKEKMYVCREATELHVEICETTGTGGCAASGGGYARGDEITFGTLVDGDSPKGGDAYDCDVNDDGIYDPETERFYYLHTKPGKKAVLLHYASHGDTDVKYDVAQSEQLPSADAWSNPNLKSFDNGKTSRFPTISDLSVGCGGITVTSDNSLLNCKFTLEDTSYVSATDAAGKARRSTYWVQTEGTKYYRVHKNSRKVDNPTSDSTKVSVAHPVIEVYLKDIQGLDTEENISDEVVTYDITSDAVNNYYANVNNWIVDETTFFTNMKSNYDENNCKATSIDPQISTDFPTNFRYATTGTVYCDKPKGYDTKTTDELKVYLSDENTKEKGDEVNYVSVANGVITNMIPGITYYWESTADEDVHGYVKAAGQRRLIDLPRARNVRDLGGITAANGRKIQYGRIMRGERLDSGDVTALGTLGLTKEYDVRSENNGSHFAEGYERHALMNYDIMYDKGYYDAARSALTSFMNDIIAGENIYVHCTHGSDRTGTLIYLAEALLGVSDEDRHRDFDLTSISGRPDRTRFYDHMAQNVSGYDSSRKYVYMKTNLPDEAAVREWYFHGSTDREADEQLIEAYQNAVLE